MWGWRCDLCRGDRAQDPGAGVDDPNIGKASSKLVLLLFVAFTSLLMMTLASRAAAAECVNQALRAENRSLTLPDCRAYERVTPAFKNGAQFATNLGYVGDGPRLVFEVFANFAGTENSTTLGSPYEFSRGPNGWTVTALYPPAGEFGGSNGFNLRSPLFALGSNGTNLLGLRRRAAPVDDERLYVRRGGSLDEVGPEVPASTLIGLPYQEAFPNDPSLGKFQIATDDLSHIVFELFSPGAHNYLWPFDPTGEGFFSSIYEYAGIGNSAPILVGVRGGQGSNQLISGCGTSVGSSASQDTYNAISSDGSTVFFTPAGEDLVGPCASSAGAPPTTQLFARVDGETSAAHTVAISEPEPASGDCDACQTPLSAEATFQGASEDGSKVFFLTAGELLPGNPGTNLYEYDFRAPPGDKVTAVSHVASNAEADVKGVVRVSEDGSHVYFVASAILTGEPNSVGGTAEAGEANLYAYDTETGSTKFVATLSAADAAAWSPTDIGRQAEATPDGRYLLFASVADLTPDDSSSVSQLFRYDAANGELVRVSVGQNGYNSNGNTEVDPVMIPRRFDRYALGQNSPPQKVMSADGSEIFFESTKALTPKAIDHQEVIGSGGALAVNIYEWQDGEISLISDGRDLAPNGEQGTLASAVALRGTDSSGDDVFFTTASALVPADEDNTMDVYDARIDGGFSAASSSPSCSGEGCQGGVAAAPSATAPGSSSLVGPGNPEPRHKKKHRHHRKRHHHKRHAQGKKKDGTPRRTGVKGGI